MMGKIIDTTNILDGSMSLKSRVPKNMVSRNYYLKSLQEKINREWKYRYNVVDIEEEKDFGSEIYTPIEVVIQTIYDVKSKTNLGDDWKKIVFKDLQHDVDVGKRYRFSFDFNGKTSDDEKNIWITVNTNKTISTQSVSVRRCDSFLTFVSDKGDIHYEPAILETDFEAINLYRDKSIIVPQADVYVIMQFNKYTRSVAINDRFVIGPIDKNNRNNNDLFKVKAMRRFNSLSTYNVDDIPLIFLALERNSVSAGDNFENRVVVDSPIYYTDNLVVDIPEENHQPDKEHNYKIVIESDDILNNKILLNKTKNFSCFLYDNDIRQDNFITISTDLLSTDKDIYYYDFIQQDGNHFSIYNKKAFLKGKLKIICSTNIDGQEIINEFLIELGGNS